MYPFTWLRALSRRSPQSYEPWPLSCGLIASILFLSLTSGVLLGSYVGTTAAIIALIPVYLFVLSLVLFVVVGVAAALIFWIVVIFGALISLLGLRKSV